MKTIRSTLLCLLTCSALGFGCGDTFDEEVADETGDESTPVDVSSPAPDPCADGQVSGYEMSTPEAALAAYACLREANSLQVDVHRRGKPTTIEIPIK